MDIGPYIVQLDQLLLMDRKLVEAFDVEELWPDTNPSDTVGFDHFYIKLSEWAVDQTELSYEEFAQIDLDRNERLNEFKKKVDTTTV